MFYGCPIVSPSAEGAFCYSVLKNGFDRRMAVPTFDHLSYMAGAPQPRTIALDLSDRIQGLIGRSDRYLGRDNFEARQLLRDCDRLQQASAFDGAICRMYLAEAYGDADEVRQLARQARAVLPEHASEADFQLAQVLVSLGYFSEAQAIYAQVGSPERGHMSNRFDLGMVCGSIEKLHEFVNQAKAMSIALHDGAVSAALGAYAVYQKTSTTDRQAGELLDLAGEVLRAHKLLSPPSSPTVSAIDHSELKTMLVQFVVRAPVEEIGAMNFELAELVARRLDVVPAGVAVVFVGVAS
ncbi:Uncharacterised protein [Achromobacter sp. 2789STDY5608615]|nr:Uncharacterised protein [Achromobacter sp. 2789STDY5608615]